MLLDVASTASSLTPSPSAQVRERRQVVVIGPDSGIVKDEVELDRRQLQVLVEVAFLDASSAARYLQALLMTHIAGVPVCQQVGTRSPKAAETQIRDLMASGRDPSVPELLADHLQLAGTAANHGPP